MRTIIILSMLFMTILACRNDDGVISNSCNDQSYLEVYRAEFDAANDAAEVYGMEPNKENCEALRNALQVYVDAVSEWEDCARITGTLDQWRASIDSANTTISTIDCE